MIVIADTSPLNYLVLIHHAELLAAVYGKIILPAKVLQELQRPGAPEAVKDWASNLPAWVEVQDAPPIVLGVDESDLDEGELAALQLAVGQRGCLVLLDDAAGRRAATALGIQSIGTVGILIRGSQLGLVDLDSAISALKGTSFYMSRYLLNAVAAHSGLK
ncbi:MAG: DUF3368 domain-containing protein [Acidobacteria bacterium]|nr:DUF3368 domain-containing protein [Acidobacteriota bacterium]